MPSVVKALSARTVLLLLVLAALASPAAADEWANWRGPSFNGISAETGLVSSWSLEGENLIWRDDFSGRSTPIVFDGRVCAIGRTGADITRQESVVCWNAETGDRLWERNYTVYNTYVPWNRLGWGSVAGDPETGYLYLNTSNGVVAALDRDGETVWQHKTAEDYDRKSGYGGRTHTPIVDEGRVILSVINSGWGKQGLPSMRYWAFDKHTGEIIWISQPAGKTGDMNTQSTPVITVIDGQRALVSANSDGTVVAFKARTGEKFWQFPVSKVALNAGVVAADGVVIASHSEENLDSNVMGRVYGINFDGTERWQVDGLKAGYSTPLVVGDRAYVLDNPANLYALNLKTGEEIWRLSTGTVGKSGPVYADGKIFVTEVNGKFHIIEDKGDHAEVLSTVHIKMPDGSRDAEIYASPAVAYNRIYLVTEEGIYSIGDKSKPFKAEPSASVEWPEKPAAKDAKPALIHIVPAELFISTDDTPSFHVRAYDDMGHEIGKVVANFSVDGLKGKMDGSTLHLEPTGGNGLQTGHVVAEFGGLKAMARIRAAGPLPWSEDFESYEVDSFPPVWLGKGKKAKVKEADGNKHLEQPDPESFAPRAKMYLGPSFLTDYTMQADIMSGVNGRRKAEVGVFNSGYSVLLAGIQQRIEVRSWGSELRMMQRQKFEWEMETWYTLKVRVETEMKDGSEQAVIRTKVWKRGTEEPADWTFVVHDPLPIKEGAPGLYSFTRGVNAYFDNILITEND